MKTKWMIIPVIALILGCSREMDNRISYIEGEFTLYAAIDENRTKTVLQQDGSIYWSPMDCINVFYGGLSGKFASNNTVPADYAEFTGLLGAFNLDGTTEFVAVYPYSQETSLSGNTLSVNLPSEQEAVEGTFADNLYISVAKSKDYNLLFKNVCGGVKFSLARNDIKKVVFRGNNGESLAGRLNVIFDSGGIPQVSGINDGSASVSLVAPNGGTFKKGAWYYLVLAPQSLSKGYTMELYGDELVETESSESPVTIRRSAWGVLKNLGEIDDSGRFIYYTSPGGQIVSPRDESCFGDATLISNKYENGIGVMEFDKPLTVIEMSAFGFCNFETVTLPEGLTDIEGYAFGYCTSLKSISFPSTLRSLGFHAIRDCYSLTTVEIPGNLDDLSDAAFDNCTSLRAFYGKYASDDHRWLIADGVVKAFAPADLTACSIPSYATAIGDYVFHSCSKLKTITIPDGVLTIGSGSFAGCSAMSTVTIPETVTAIGPGAFSQCFGLQAFYGKYASEDHRCLVVEGATVGFAPVGLTDYTIPPIVTNIAYSTFMHCSQLKTITIPSTVTTIGEYAFWGCSSLDSITILSGTPPRLASIQVPTAIFDDTNECPIYVPSGSVEAYKTASGWSRYAERIQEIKNNPIPVPELVDLGLSVKWATFNVGATSPEEFGNHYAWGETKPKEEYSWDTYTWCNGTRESLTKYCYDSQYGYNGFTDGKTILLPEDDAATVNLGKNWRMPTQEESWELAGNTTISLVEYNGVTVFELKSTINGNVVYFPIAGYRDENPGLHDATYYRSYYWCSNIDSYRTYDGYNFCLSNEDYYDPYGISDGCILGVYTWAHRYKGYTIRPVYDDR